MKELLYVSKFLGWTRRKLRYGAYSREPLLLLRIEWKGDSVECDWLMRPQDPLDKAIPENLARENQTMQALADAMSLREAVFKSFPAVAGAKLRMFRSDTDHRLDLVMIGNVSRNNEVLQRVASLVMRAKLCGFQFKLEKGGMENISAA